MVQTEIRKLILKALVSDSWLYEHLVLKGGNALSIVYGIGARSSLDLDFSIKESFSDLDQVGERIERVLRVAFSPHGIEVFDFEIAPRPSIVFDRWWGGYTAEFKLISYEVATRLDHRRGEMQRQAITVDAASQRRKYKIEISKFEYVEDSVVGKVDGVDVRVYSPVLLAAEKLRALLQQHPSYPQIAVQAKRSRSRDLYDIWTIADQFAVKLEEYLNVVEVVFATKKVDLHLLSKFREVHDIHLGDWADVQNSVGAELNDFDFYFEFVASIAEELYAKWIAHSP